MFNHLKTKVNKESSSKLSNDQNSIKNDSSLKRTPSVESINSTATSDTKSRKRDDIVKKWESKVQNLVVTVREKNIIIEDLEKKLVKDKSDYEKKITELKESSALNVKSLLDEHRKQILKLEQMYNLKQRDKFQKQAKDSSDISENLRNQCFNVSEEADSIKDFTKQELAKVKHMLRQKEVENENLLSELENIKSVNERMEYSRNSLSEDIQKKIADLNRINKDRETELEERRSLQTTIRGLLSDKDSLERTNDDLTAKLSKTEGLLNKIERCSAELHSKVQQSTYDNDQLKVKLTRLESEKQDRESDLKDRIRSLENHLAMVRESQTVDDQVKILEEKCFKWESKNREEKELNNKLLQSWNERVQSLEIQIANLNIKIAEDAQELSNHQEIKDEIRNGYEKSIKELKKELADKVKHIEQLQNELDAEVAKLAQTKTVADKSQEELYNNLQNKSQECHDLSHDNFEMKKEQVKLQEQLNTTQSELRGKSTFIMKLEEELKKLKEELEEKTEELSGLNAERFKRELKVTDLTSQISNLESTKIELEKSLSQIDSDFKSLQKQLKQTVEDRDSLKRKSDQLNDQNQSLKSDCDHRIKLMQTEVDSRCRELEINHANIRELEQQIRDMESEKETVIIGMESTEVLKLKNQLEILNSQLSEKNNMIRSQKLKISDLKKTLSKEIRSNNNNGSLSRVHSNIEFNDSNNLSTGSDISLYKEQSINPQRIINSNTQQISQHQKSSGMKSTKQKSGSSSEDDGPVVVDNNGLVIMDQINFKYLKHVLLKFLLSKESEAIQLIKAVSTLLKLTDEEELKIKSRLDQKKSSWFSNSNSNSSSSYDKSNLTSKSPLRRIKSSSKSSGSK